MPIQLALARDLIRNGDLIATGCRRPVPRLIQWWTHSDVSHVELAVWRQYTCNYEPELGSIGATGAGVRWIPLDVLVAKYAAWGGHTWVYPHNGNPYDGNRVAQEAVKMERWPYPNRFQHVLAGVRWMRAAWKALTQADLDIDIRAVMCSEFVSTALDNAGYHPGTLPAVVRPVDLTTCGWWPEENRYEITL